MSENEVVVKSGRKIAVGSDYWDLRDDGTPVRYVDFITELRQHNSVVYLSIGSAVIDANNTPFVDIACRMRMDLGTAQNLHSLLGTMISDMLKPADQSKTN
jgi:hypothetical protein